MDGYVGSDDIVEKLEYATTVNSSELYWGEVMTLLRQALAEIKELRGHVCIR